MASSYSDLGIELMATGENAGTWGTKTNTNLQIVEKAIAGYVEQAVTSGGTTALSITDGDATESTSVARHAVIKLTGTITGNSIVTVPDSIEKVYIVTNGTSGAYTVQFKTASGTGITFGVSEKTTRLVYSDGTNLVDAGFGGALDIEGRELVLDADGDTTITADTDDQIDIKIAGADDFQFTANTFTAQSGSTIAAQALTATTITASGIVKTDDTTEATSTTDGSLQTDGGLSVAKDAVIGDDLKLLSDSAVLSFGADSDTTLTHTDGTGLTLNSTNKLLFGDTGTYIHQSADGVLDLVSDTEIEINATTIDINGAVAMDGAITGATNITLSGELDAATLDISGDADIDGTLETDALSINGTTITTTAAEINLIDGGTARGTTAVADGDGLLVNDAGTMRMTNVTTLKTYFQTGVTAAAIAADDISTGDGAVTIATSSGDITIDAQAGDADIIFKGTDSSSDITALTLDMSAAGAATFNDKVVATELDISGNMDIDGTSNLDAVDIDGAVQIDAAVTVGVDDTGYDFKLFGATSGSFLLWDESDDALELTDSSPIKIGDGGDMQIYHDGSNSYITNSTGALKIATETSGIAITLGHSTSEITVGDNLTVTGDLTVSGTTTTVNSTTVNLNDHNIVLDSGNSTSAVVNGGGITLEGGSGDDATFTYNTTGPKFELKLGSSHESLQIDQLIAASLDISGDVDVDGTLEADAITVNGTTLAEFISDTTGAMVSSNTETGITVTYQDGDNTIDFALAAAQTTITSLLATDIKIGEDDETKIDFETADEIHFYAANTEQVYVGDNIFGPQSDSDVDLGSSSVRWKDAYVDTVTSTSTITTGAGIVIADAGNIGSASDTDAIAIASNGVVTFSQTPVLSGASISAGTTPLTALDIDGATDIGEAVVDADLFIVDNGAGGTNRKVAASRLVTYIDANSSAASVGKAIAMAIVFG
jgi:cytoskeletal protein CcmA (bactofilin family)